jgi:NADH:ubiquinone oxidoreductase subunit 3 (subunit A)
LIINFLFFGLGILLLCSYYCIKQVLFFDTILCFLGIIFLSSFLAIQLNFYFFSLIILLIYIGVIIVLFLFFLTIYNEEIDYRDKTNFLTNLVNGSDIMKYICKISFILFILIKNYYIFIASFYLFLITNNLILNIEILYKFLEFNTIISNDLFILNTNINTYSYLLIFIILFFFSIIFTITSLAFYTSTLTIETRLADLKLHNIEPTFLKQNNNFKKEFDNTVINLFNTSDYIEFNYENTLTNFDSIFLDICYLSLGFLVNCLFIIILLSLSYFIFFNKKLYNTSKFSAYECGFQSYLLEKRKRIFIIFYIFGILFLLFDIEILFLFPFLCNIILLDLHTTFIFIFFIISLIISLIYEFSTGLLNIDKLNSFEF